MQVGNRRQLHRIPWINFSVNFPAVDLHDGHEGCTRHRIAADLGLSLDNSRIEGRLDAGPRQGQGLDTDKNFLLLMICLEDSQVGLSGDQFVVGNEILLEQLFSFVQPILRPGYLRLQRGQASLGLCQHQAIVVVVEYDERIAFAQCVADIHRDILDQRSHLRRDYRPIRRYHCGRCPQLLVDQQIAQTLHGDRHRVGRDRGAREQRQNKEC